MEHKIVRLRCDECDETRYTREAFVKMMMKNVDYYTCTGCGGKLHEAGIATEEELEELMRRAIEGEQDND